MKNAVALCIVCSVALAGCGSGRSLTDATARRDARMFHAQWLGMIEHSGPAGQRFRHVSEREFRRQLAVAAGRYGFTVEKVAFRHAGRVTPLVLVESRRSVAFAHSVRDIEMSLDPHRGHSDLRGWRFRAFFFEAEDGRGVPFLSVSNVVDAASVSGGQWARSDALYPFLHG